MSTSVRAEPEVLRAELNAAPVTAVVLAALAEEAMLAAVEAAVLAPKVARLPVLTDILTVNLYYLVLLSLAYLIWKNISIRHIT